MAADARHRMDGMWPSMVSWPSAWFLRVGISIPLFMGLQNIPCRRVGRRGRGGEGKGAEEDFLQE